MPNLYDLTEEPARAPAGSAGINLYHIDGAAPAAPPEPTAAAPIQEAAPTPAPATVPAQAVPAGAVNLFAMDTLGKDAAAAAKSVDDAAGGYFSMSWRGMKDSPIGAGLKYLNVPLEFVAGQVVRTADRTVAPGIEKKLNPDGKWVPDIGLNDVVNYALPDSQTMKQKFLDSGITPFVADRMAEAYWGTRTGLGMAANVFGDPLFITGASIEKTGAGLIARTRFGEANLQPAVDAMKSAGQAIRESKAAPLMAPVDAVSRTIDAFNPWTGILEVDVARAGHKALMRGDDQKLRTFLKDGQKFQLTESETGVLRKAIESTPSLVTPQIEAAAETAKVPLSARVGGPKEIVDAQLADFIPKIAAESKVSLTPDRMEAIHQAALHVKGEAADLLHAQLSRGVVSPQDLNQFAIENYMVHKISPEAKAWLQKNPEMAAAIEEGGIKAGLEKALSGKTVSSYDPTKYRRQYRTSLDEANAILAEKTKGGVTKWFIDDPIVAQAQKSAEVRKFLRDKDLLDTIAEHGVRPANGAERKALMAKGYQTINHPEFEGKTFILKSPEESVRVKYQDMLFPSQIAEKVSYDIIPRSKPMLYAFLDSFNRTFRSFALFRPDYYLENWGDNILKNVVNGVTIQDYADTAKILMGAEGKVEIAGKDVAMSEVRKIMDSYNVRSTHAVEDMEKLLYTGKKITTEQTLMGKAKVMGENANDTVMKVLKGMNVVGERGENFTRISFFLNRIRKGDTAEQAAYQVEKFLFDFSRTTPAMDAYRRFVNPFAQAAFKTAFISPELVAKKPWLWSAYENNLMKTFQDAFHDPVTSAAVQQLYPDYYRFHDRIAGPLLPGNHWLAILAGADPRKEGQGLPVAIAFGLPGGLGILNQFALWDQRALQQMGSSPVLRSLLISLTGKDPFNGKNVDIPNDPNMVSRRVSVALRDFVEAPFATPNLLSMIKRQYGLGDPDYLTSNTVLALHGSMGKFGRLTNLDREFSMKWFAMVSARKELVRELVAAKAREVTGKSPDIALSEQPVQRSLLKLGKNASSAEVYRALTQNVADMYQAKIAAGVLRKDIKPEDVAGLIKNIDQTIRQLNQNYNTLTEGYFRAAHDLSAERAAQFRAESDAAFSKAIAGDETPTE